jgi:hypothetical protein
MEILFLHFLYTVSWMKFVPTRLKYFNNGELQKIKSRFITWMLQKIVNFCFVLVWHSAKIAVSRVKQSKAFSQELKELACS